MKKPLILGAFLVSLLLVFLLMAGCGDSGEQAATETESSATTEHPSAEAATETAAEPAAEAAEGAEGEETVAVHDCAGGCGMHAVPEDQMTEIDGKWYCAACAKKVQAEGHGDG